MLVRDLLNDKDFKLVNAGNLDLEITGVYCGDLLSWVMSHIKSGNAWCTVLSHVNIIAIAILTQISLVIITEDAPIDSETIKKAQAEGVNVFKTSLNSAEVVKRMIEHD